MTVTRLSTKGRVVLPKEVRDALGLSSGDKLEIDVRDGVVLLRPIRMTTVDGLLGLLPWAGPQRSEDELDRAIARSTRSEVR